MLSFYHLLVYLYNTCARTNPSYLLLSPVVFSSALLSPPTLLTLYLLFYLHIASWLKINYLLSSSIFLYKSFMACIYKLFFPQDSHTQYLNLHGWNIDWGEPDPFWVLPPASVRLKSGHFLEFVVFLVTYNCNFTFLCPSPDLCLLCNLIQKWFHDCVCRVTLVCLLEHSLHLLSI